MRGPFQSKRLCVGQQIGDPDDRQMLPEPGEEVQDKDKQHLRDEKRGNEPDRSWAGRRGGRIERQGRGVGHQPDLMPVLEIGHAGPGHMVNGLDASQLAAQGVYFATGL